MGTKIRWLLISVCGVLFALTLVGVFDVRYYFFDEPVYIDAAQSLIDGEEIRNWEHPPLGKYFILAGRAMMSEHKVAGARLPSVVALLVTLAFLGLTAERLFAGRVAVGLPGALVILLALTDPLLVNLSKVAMLEVFVVAFTCAGLYFTVCWLQDRRPRDILWLGLFCGLAVASKWSAVPVFAVFFAAVLIKEWKWGVAALALAFSIYVLSFIPYLALRTQPVTLADIVSLHRYMFQFHKTFSYDFPHQSPWYSWPILYRPIWLLAETVEGRMQGFFLLGNILTYLVGPIGLVWYAVKRPTPQSGLLLVGYLSTLIFWAIAGRKTYFYYYIMCSPFLYLGALAVIWQAYKRKPVLAYSVVAGIVLIFAVYYPLVGFVSMPQNYTRAILFVPSWRYLFN